MPNGLARGPDGLIYVPSTFSGEIRVYALNEHHTFDFITSIPVPYPIDNMSFDSKGDLFTANFPQVYKWIESVKSPLDVKVPAAVFRVRKIGDKSSGRRGLSQAGKESLKFVVEKVMEDDGTTLPSATIAVHDAVTGRFFLGGAMASFITICETR